MAFHRILLALICILAGTEAVRAQALPINIQGRVATNGVAFSGIGRFKFAIIRGNGEALLWSHDGTGTAPGFQPNTSLALTVNRGLYAVLLGDPATPGMTSAIDPAIFQNPDVRLRVWFNDGVNNFQQLIPDQRMGAVGFAMTAERADVAGSVTGNIPLQQLPPVLVTNNATEISLTGAFTGDGSGLVGIRGSTPWQVAANPTNNAFPNTGYLVVNAAQTTIRLPENASMRVGDIVRVAGANGGSWQLLQRENQAIFAGRFTGGIAARWRGTQSNRAWTGIASSADGSRLYAGDYNNGFIYFSTDSGNTWTNPSPSPQKKWRGFATSADGQRVLAAAEDNTLTMSTDGGINWSARANAGSAKWWSVAASADGTNLVAVAFGGALTISTNGGDNWVANAAAGSPRNWISVACSSDGNSIVAAANGERLYGTKNRGASWIAFTAAGSRQWTGIASSADGMRLVAVANNAQIMTSADGGTNWTARTSSPAAFWSSVASSADGSKLVAVASQNKVYNSLDGGATWAAQLGDAIWYGVSCSSDGTRIAATVNGGQIWVSNAQSVRFTSGGTAGYLVGDEFSAVELQHIGNGIFMPLSHTGTIYAY